MPRSGSGGRSGGGGRGSPGRGFGGGRGSPGRGYGGYGGRGSPGRGHGGYGGRIGSPGAIGRWRGKNWSGGWAKPYWSGLSYSYPIYNNWWNYYPSGYYGDGFNNYDYQVGALGWDVPIATAGNRGAAVINGQCIETTSTDPAVVGRPFFIGSTCDQLVTTGSPASVAKAALSTTQPSVALVPVSQTASQQASQPAQQSNLPYLVIGVALLGAILVALIMKK